MIEFNGKKWYRIDEFFEANGITSFESLKGLLNLYNHCKDCKHFFEDISFKLDMANIGRMSLEEIFDKYDIHILRNHLVTINYILKTIEEVKNETK